ncbi:hypothetical protein BH23GEM7_BH23GEM7_36810 [soil metagenome]|jgi:uncharacterized membrane protein YccC
MLGALLTLFAFGLAGVVLFAVAMALLGVVFSVVFGVAGFLLFKVAPLLLLGWLILKLIGRRGGRSRRLSAADRKWLDS